MKVALGHLTRSVAFVMLTSAIVVVASEKMFWYTSTNSPGAVLELILFYSLAVMPLLYVMGRYAVDTTARLILAAGVFAMVVEGVLTPIVYSDGPLPVMFLYFLGWHGLLSVLFLWHTIHHWALTARRRTMTVTSVLVGVAWGVWSTNYWRPSTIAEQLAENREEPGLWDVGQWTTPKFALSAFGFTALVMACHWLSGFVWPSTWTPSRGWTITVALAIVAYLGVWTFAIPYAPVKFAAFVGFAVWLLRRSKPSPGSATLLARNAGRVRLVNLIPLLAMPAGAVASYALMVQLDTGASTLDTIYWTFVTVTVAAGTVGAIWAGSRP